MKKILVPTIDWPASSDAAYRIAEIADAIQADVVVLFVVQSLNGESYRRGNLSIEIFEEAAQDYDFSVDGFIMMGDPMKIICRMAEKTNADLILLGATEEDDWSQFSPDFDGFSNCQVELLASYSPDA